MSILTKSFKLGVCCIALAGLLMVSDAVWIKAKAQLAQWLIASAWDEPEAKSDDDISKRPWPWADTWPMARLQIPQLGIEQFVMAGLDGESLAFGPGMAVNTQLEQGMMIAGHKDTHFDYLQRLRPGDRVQVQLHGERLLEFEVSAVGVLELGQGNNQLVVAPSELALVTCYPFGVQVSDPQLRYLVTARRLEYAEPLAVAGVLDSLDRSFVNDSREDHPLHQWLQSRAVKM
ncbi:class GN sortase [Corallincola spongiicola]|uniref:Class GN sortase n=1 Tax=Corallincola spongiicola TaxID=2520508 RepID=A0ABY1WUT6_9GAMM|nr:class GN sortase [Corallincola spongiicola]TAA48513.1 class GN sortase [Corallincola spongiicola]